MFESSSTFTDPTHGRCELISRVEDDGSASIELRHHGGPTMGVVTRLDIPKGMLNRIHSQVLNLVNVERLRQGLDRVHLDEDDPDLEDCQGEKAPESPPLGSPDPDPDAL